MCLSPHGEVWWTHLGVYKKMVAAKDFKLTYDMLRENNIIGVALKMGDPQNHGIQN